MASYTTLLSLPNDMIREILLRIPVESLVPSKLTCKIWRDIIDDNYNDKKTFIYEHLDRSPVRFLKLDIRKVGSLQIMDLVNRRRSDSKIPVEIRQGMEYPVLCDGLVLCFWKTILPKLALWNPLTRNIYWVELDVKQVSPEDVFGIGYTNNKAVRDYKILKFPAEKDYSVEIYECNSKSWKILEVAKVDRHVHRKSSNGVSVNGNMYWVALEQKRKPYILGFDFSLEKFKDICVCPSSSPLPDRDYPPYDAYLGGLNGDSLSLLEQKVSHEKGPIVVWVSSKLADGNVSFVKHFSVPCSLDLPLLYNRFTNEGPVYCIAKNKRIITLSRSPTCALLIHEMDKNGLIRTRKVKGFSDYFTVDCFCGYVYVPSLVTLP